MVTLLAGLAVLLAPVMTFVLINQSPDSPVIEDQSIEVAYISPVEITSFQETPVQIAFTWGEPEQVYWPGIAGLITKVNAEAGHLISSGTVVVEVDGQGIMALQTTDPFHRDLAFGDEGADVLALTNALHGLGMLGQSAVGESYSWAVAAGVKKMNAEIGLSSNAFYFQRVVWISETLEVVKIFLKAGTPTPGKGEPVLDAGQTLQTAQVISANFSQEGAGQPVRFNDGLERLVAWEGREFALTTDGQISDQENLLLLVSPGQELATEATMQLGEAQRFTQLPSSAVLAGMDGSFCVRDAKGREITVTVLSGRAGTVNVAESFVNQIVLNPVRSGLAFSCVN